MEFEVAGHAAKRARVECPTGVFRHYTGQQYGGHEENRLARKREDPKEPNRILLLTVLNPVYPITVDVIHTICSPSGQVLRIVIFRKNGLQAMVEFDSLESAQRVKDTLNGCDIYSGCCTLRIEYAKPTKLNVFKNDSESWDYTNLVNIGKPVAAPETPQPPARPVLLSEPPRFESVATYRPESLRTPHIAHYAAPVLARYENGQVVSQNGGFTGSLNGALNGGFIGVLNGGISSTLNGGLNGALNGRLSGGILQGVADQMADRIAIFSERPRIKQAGTNGLLPVTTQPSYVGLVQPSSGNASNVPQQGAVMMVYGLNQEKVNADKLFNLFCLYGNVVRVKFLKTKEGCAMVQLGDTQSVERAIQHLNNTTFFNSKIQLGYSKQAFLSDVQQPHTLPDGTPTFKDYMGNKNNRFINPEMASKNRVQPPSKVLHFFNTPPRMEEAQIQKIFADAGVTPPKNVKMFPSKTERSSSGLLEFENMSQSLEGLLACNHTPIANPTGKFPFIMKLCFSSSRPTHNQNQPNLLNIQNIPNISSFANIPNIPNISTLN